MGQAFGVPLAHADIRPFTNLPKEALQSIWTSYNLLGEGWGLELPDFKAIFLNAPHLMSMGFTDAQLEALFIALDTDNNGLVDALESLAVLALVSGTCCLHLLPSLCASSPLLSHLTPARQHLYPCEVLA